MQLGEIHRNDEGKGPDFRPVGGKGWRGGAKARKARR
jgi:hypothetical protein